MNSKKTILQYCMSLTVLSIIQLIIINGVVTKETEEKIFSNTYIDGTDFSPLMSFVSNGIGSFVFFISELFTIIFGVIISLILMSVIRFFSNKTIEKEEKKFNSRYTLIVSLAFIMIILTLARFKLIIDIIIMYIAVPIISWLVFHLGKKTSRHDE